MIKRNIGHRAFTVLELLVVIAVLGILFAIVIPRFKGMQQNAKLAKAKKELQVIKAALESYRTFDNSHAFPLSTTATSSLQADYLINAAPNIIGTVMKDPLSENEAIEYKYMTDSNAKYYIIWSVGVSGQSEPTAVSPTGDISY